MNIERSEEQHKHDDIPALGQLLQKARLDLGMTDEDVADRLKLRVAVVRSIEAMKGEQSQITTFTRGYIRSYAKLVGLDANYLLNSNNQAYQVEPVEHQLQSFSKKTSDEQLDNRVMVLTWFIFAIVIGITMFWWWQNPKQGEWHSSETESAKLLTEEIITDADIKENIDEMILTSQSVDGLSREQSKVEIEDLAALNVAQSETIALNVSAPKIEADASLASIENKTNTQNQPKSEVENLTTLIGSNGQPLENKDLSEQNPYASLLTMSFVADCWVDVLDANGKRLLTGVKSAGETIELSGDMPYKLVIGAPRAVRLTFEGEAVDLSKYSPKQVARFSLPN